MLSGDETQKELWKRYDAEFHQSLISACGSRNLMELHAMIYDKYLRYQMQILTYRGDQAANEHKHLYEATLDRDIDRADKLLRHHIESGLKHTLEESASLQD